MSPSYTLAQLAETIGGSVRGDGTVLVRGVGDIAEAGPSDITWISSARYADKLPTSRAGAVLVALDFGPTPMPAILCERVDRGVAKLLAAFAPPVSRREPGVHPAAVVHETAWLDDSVSVGPHAVIERGARVGFGTIVHAGVFVGQDTNVGRDCVIWPNVVIRDGCKIGDRVIIHPNAVIGADGLGFYFAEGRHHKIPHIGGVVVEDDVEIGACTCIDRAKFGNTIVGRGSKIDNLVQIGHNARIGEHCVLAGQTGIAGSTRIGNYCIFGGRAATSDHVTIGDGARVALTAVVTKDIPPGITVSGFPARDHREEMRERAELRRVPKLAEQVRALTARIEQLETATHHPA